MLSYKCASENPTVKVFKSTTLTQEKFALLKACRICVDGNIGAGKTTFTQSLERYLKRRGIACDLAVEDMSNKMQMLELFLKNPSKYAFAFQMMMLSERINIYKCALPEYTAGKTQIIDRSLVGDYSFAYLHHKYGNINDDEWAAYKEMLEQYADKDFFKVPDYYLYLEVLPEKALQRITQRNRGNEAETYQLQYLQDLTDAHRQSFEDLGINYIQLDWNANTSLDDEGLIDDAVIADIVDKIIRLRCKHVI